jgi:hypothetical protein
VVAVTARVTDDAIGKRRNATRGVLDHSIEVWIGPHARMDRANHFRRAPDHLAAGSVDRDPVGERLDDKLL